MTVAALGLKSCTINKSNRRECPGRLASSPFRVCWHSCTVSRVRKRPHFRCQGLVKLSVAISHCAILAFRLAFCADHILRAKRKRNQHAFCLLQTRKMFDHELEDQQRRRKFDPKCGSTLILNLKGGLKRKDRRNAFHHRAVASRPM